MNVGHVTDIGQSEKRILQWLQLLFYIDVYVILRKGKYIITRYIEVRVCLIVGRYLNVDIHFML